MFSNIIIQVKRGRDATAAADIYGRAELIHIKRAKPGDYRPLRLLFAKNLGSRHFPLYLWFSDFIDSIRFDLDWEGSADEKRGSQLFYKSDQEPPLWWWLHKPQIITLDGSN